MNNSLVNTNAANLSAYIGRQLNAKIIKIRWNNKDQATEAIFEINNENIQTYAVDVITPEKRLQYLKMCHAKPETLVKAMSRTENSYYCSLSACFGRVAHTHIITAKVRPYNGEYGVVGIDVRSTGSVKIK